MCRYVPEVTKGQKYGFLGNDFSSITSKTFKLQTYFFFTVSYSTGQDGSIHILFDLKGQFVNMTSDHARSR